MKKHKKIDVYQSVILLILILASASCLLPVINLLAESLSASEYAVAGLVTFWPKGFTLESYQYVLRNDKFWNAMKVTMTREVLGISLGLIITVLTAYPLSKSVQKFKGRTFFVWLFFFTTLFSGGTIAWYFNIKQLGLLDNMMALILPGLVNVFDILLLLNFFRGIPSEIEEAAMIDGADHFTTLFKVYLPMSMPCMATITLYIVIRHWNAWFDGTMLMKSSEGYPLSSFLRTLLFSMSANESSAANSSSDWQMYTQISARTIRSAQMFTAMVPVMMVYPFLQKYFVKGIMLGGVKG